MIQPSIHQYPFHSLHQYNPSYIDMYIHQTYLYTILHLDMVQTHILLSPSAIFITSVIGLNFYLLLLLIQTLKPKLNGKRIHTLRHKRLQWCKNTEIL